MKKNMYAMLCGGIMLLGPVACAKAPSEPQTAEASGAVAGNAEESTPAKNQKILVAYYSYSGNTRAVAQQIAQHIGADLFEINTVEKYPSAYGELTNQAKQEINAGFKPALSAQVENMAQYDVVFIGSPNWWGTIAPAVSSFIAQYNWEGKKVAGFFTHGGGGIQNCGRDLKQQLPMAEVLPAVAFPGRSSGAPEKELQAWLKGLKL